jgi:hypothetical protein
MARRNGAEEITPAETKVEFTNRENCMHCNMTTPAGKGSWDNVTAKTSVVDPDPNPDPSGSEIICKLRSGSIIGSGFGSGFESGSKLNSVSN